MEDLRNDRQETSGSGWTTTAAAAKALGVSSRRVRQFITDGDLKGKLEEGTDKRIWLVSVDSLSTLRVRRGISSTLPETDPEIAGSTAEMFHDLAVRLEARATEAAELRTRLELTEKSHTTLQEERNQLAQRLGHAEEQVETFRQELEEEKSKGFWQRLFGG